MLRFFSYKRDSKEKIKYHKCNLIHQNIFMLIYIIYLLFQGGIRKSESNPKMCCWWSFRKDSPSCRWQQIYSRYGTE